MHYFAVFLPNSISTGMSYLPGKDEVVSFKPLFFPRAVMNRIIQQWLYGVDERSISLFASFLEKENALETLILIFENVSPKGFSQRTRTSRF